MILQVVYLKSNSQPPIYKENIILLDQMIFGDILECLNHGESEQPY